MTYYLNPYVLIIRRGHSYYYHFNGTLYHLTLREYELLNKLPESQTLIPNERFDIFIETKLLIDRDYKTFTNNVDFVNRGWFEMSSFNEESFFKISQSKILILGCGGTGTHVAWNLAALGIKKFVLIDDDKVELNNLNRQLLYDLKDIGTYKVDALKNKLKERFSDIEISTFKIKVYDGSDISEVVDIKNIDMVVKGIDTPLDNLYKLGEYFYKNNIMYVTGGTVGTSIFLGPTYSPALQNRFRDTEEYTSNSKMASVSRELGKAISIPPLFSYIGSELTKEIIFLLTGNENKVLYNDKIVIKDIFNETNIQQKKFYHLTRFIASFMVILSMINTSILVIPSILLLFLCQILMKESYKVSFINYLIISLLIGIVFIVRQEFILDTTLQTITSIIFTLLSYICYFSIILMLLKFTIDSILEKAKFLEEL